MNLDRARTAIAAAELDGLLILSPRHFLYATGYRPWFLTMYAEAGYGAAVIPGEASLAPGAVVTDVEEGPFRATAPDFATVVTFPAWVAYADVAPAVGDDALAWLATNRDGQPTERAGQIDRDAVMQRVVDLLRELKLDTGRLGVELRSLPVWADRWLRQALPKAELVETQPLLEELRAIKSDREIELLRRGTRLAEAAIGQVTSSLVAGITAGEVARRYRQAVMDQADGGDVTGARITLRVGPDVLSSRAAGAHLLASGDVVFLDCGVEVGGYWADVGRTAVFGPATRAQRGIYGRLRAGFQAATALLAPGRPVADIFITGLAAVRAGGLSVYTRGNLGHGVGLHPAPELPIISRDETRLLTPGHVLSVEFPYYIGGIGAFTVEDTFVIGEHGNENLNRLPTELIEISG